MRTLTLMMVGLMSLTAAAQDDSSEPGYDPDWEWVGDGDNDWHEQRATIESMDYHLTSDGFFEITVVMTEPITRNDEVCVRGTWEGNFIEMVMPFAKGPMGPKLVIDSTSPDFENVTLEPTGEFIRGAHYKWYFAEPRRYPMVEIDFPYPSDNTVTVRATREFDPRIHTIPPGGWVCGYGRGYAKNTNNDRFGTTEAYEITRVVASGDEVRISTTLDELEIHHQQDGTSFWGGQFELRHSGGGDTVLKAVVRDDVGHLRPVMSENTESLTKSLPKLTIVFTRGASLSATLEKDYSGRDTGLIREVRVGSSGSMSEARVGIELPVGSYAYEFWTEGGTLVIRALSFNEFTAGQL